jgi:hypothetical protein
MEVVNEIVFKLANGGLSGMVSHMHQMNGSCE